MAEALAVFVLFGGPGLVVGALASFVFARSPKAALVTAAVGVALVVALTFVQIFSVDPDTCADCSEWRGGAITLFTFPLLIGNSLGWLLGTLIGYRLRRARGRPNRLGTTGSAS